MNRLGVVGDIHLDKLEGTLPNRPVRLQLLALKRVFDDCLRLGITTLVQVGDLFDTAQPREDTVLALASLLLRYPQIHFIVLPGNHDRPLLNQHSLKTLHWLGRHRFVPMEVVLAPQLRTLAGYRVWLCPHPFIEDQPPEAEISFGHFAWAGARHDNGHVEANGSSPAGRWILGDFHQDQVGPGERYRYVGSLTQTHWDEVHPKGYEVLTRDRTGAIRVVQRRIVQPYTLHNLVVNDPADLAKIDLTAPHAYWRLKVRTGVTLPPDWQRTYPNVRRRDPFGVQPKARARVDRVNLSEDPFEGLHDYLQERGRLQEEQITWAVNKAQLLRQPLAEMSHGPRTR